MDDWDAFDPDLHAALNASLTPPAAGDMQPAETALPAGSEETVQSAHQVQTATVPGPLAQQGYVTAATLRQSAPQVQLSSTLPAQPVQQGPFSWAAAPMFPHVQQAHASVQQAQSSAQQVHPPPTGSSGDAVDSNAGSDVTFRPIGAGGSSSGDVFGPSALRTNVAASSLSQSPRREPCRLHLPMRTPACCQPFGSGTVQRRAAIACRVVFSFAECVGLLVAGRGTSVSNGPSNRRVLGMHSRCYSETPQSEENRNSHEGKKEQ